MLFRFIPAILRFLKWNVNKIQIIYHDQHYYLGLNHENLLLIGAKREKLSGSPYKAVLIGFFRSDIKSRIEPFSHTSVSCFTVYHMERFKKIGKNERK